MRTTPVDRQARRGRRKILGVLAALAGLAAGAVGYEIYASMEPVVVRVDPRAAYLRTFSTDDAPDAVPIALSEVGLRPGHWVRLKQVGTFSNRGVEMTQQAAVFSGDERIHRSGERHRIPGAIDAGEDHVSGSSSRVPLENDIPEDFLVEDVSVEIPAGATHLFVAVPDVYYSDNDDPDGDFGVRITKLPASWWPQFWTR